jgi:hypothetical protein
MFKLDLHFSPGADTQCILASQPRLVQANSLSSVKCESSDAPETAIDPSNRFLITATNKLRGQYFCPSSKEEELMTKESGII